MWIYTTAGMVSIVAHRDDPDQLLVRSREEDTLEALFPGEQIIEMPQADYPYRVILYRMDVAELLADLVRHDLRYTNFKGAVTDPARKRAYFDAYNVTLQLDPRHKSSVEVEYETDELAPWDIGPEEKITP